MKSQGELDELVHQKTLEELQLGWVQGLVDIGKLEGHSLVAKRFGLLQGSKSRIIDDFSTREGQPDHASARKAAARILAKSKRAMLGKTFDLSSASDSQP